MPECEHNYIFQDTSKSHKVSGYEHYVANFERIDRYYCSKCLDVKEIVKNESINLPFGGVHNVIGFAPTWYK